MNREREEEPNHLRIVYQLSLGFPLLTASAAAGASTESENKKN